MNISPECNFNPALLYILYELSVKYLLGYNLILKINFQMNLSWLPTTWQSTFYGVLPKKYIITRLNLGNKLPYTGPNTSWIMEVLMAERRLNKDYKRKIRTSSLTCPDLTGKLITSFIFFATLTTIPIIPNMEFTNRSEVFCTDFTEISCKERDK